MSERVRQENVWLNVMAYRPNAGGLTVPCLRAKYMVFYHPPGPMCVDVGIEMESDPRKAEPEVFPFANQEL